MASLAHTLLGNGLHPDRTEYPSGCTEAATTKIVRRSIAGSFRSVDGAEVALGSHAEVLATWRSLKATGIAPDTEYALLDMTTVRPSLVATLRNPESR